MTDQTQTVEQIAGSLTKAQRRFVLDDAFTPNRRSSSQIRSACDAKGLINAYDDLSALGLAVKTHLQEQGS